MSQQQQQRGSGITTREIVLSVQSTSSEEFKRAMEMGGTKGKMLVAMCAAYQDGMTAMLRHLIGMGAIVIHKNDKETT